MTSAGLERESTGSSGGNPVLTQAESNKHIEEGKKQAEELWKELRDKIRSKFQVSTFLAGFGFAILNAQVGILLRPEQPLMLPFSVAILFAATAIFSASVMMLDSLMMPKIFRVRAAPSIDFLGPQANHFDFRPPPMEPKDLWQIKRRMVFVWKAMTVVPAALTLVALYLAMVSPPFTFLSDILLPINAGMQPGSVAGNLTSALSLVHWALSIGGGYIFMIWLIMHLRREKFGRFYFD